MVSTYCTVGAEDDEALDILWSMVMEEGNESAMKGLDTDSAQTMLKSHAAFSAMLDLGDASASKDNMDNGHAIEVEEMESEPISAFDPLPDIIDFTPESALVAAEYWKQIKVVVSCSSPLPEKSGEWERYLVVVRVKRRTRWSAELEVREMLLVPITQLNPYTHRCIIPLVGVVAGPRFLTIIETILPESSTDAAVADLLRHAWAQSFLNLSTNDGKPIFLPTVNNTHSSIRILTQISNGFFEMVDPTVTGTSMVDQKSESAESECNMDSSNNQGSSSGDMSHQRKIFAPAPNPAMAFVAAALTDYPNPGVAHAVSQEQLLPTIASQPLNRKRTASSDENTLIQNADLAEVASDWANAPSGDKLGESKLQNLDRRCKVRLVERLSNVIDETDNEASAKYDAKSSLLRSKNVPIHSKGFSIMSVQKIDANLSDINEDEMDSLLDGLLVRIVQNLMELASSSTDLQAELNKPDQSGFTLLHYACLYNLSSLIPILFFHGVSPDIPTTQGKMTPLHLACGAGNFSLVQLLVQKRCNITVQDSFGATPLDHALRNGFPEIATWLANQAGLDDPISKTGASDSPFYTKAVEFDDYKDILMRNAFSTLTLKDKIMLNLLEEKEHQEIKTMQVQVDNNDDNAGCFQLFSEEERKGLAVAMKLMSKEELDEILERTSGDMRKWMLMRDYETLKQADVETTHIEKHPAVVDAKLAAKKKLDEAIAGLVLRKNLDLQTYNYSPKR